MSVRKLVTVIILPAIFCLGANANAQGILPSAKAIGERLDDVGKTIFGGVFSDDKDGQENKQNKENTQNDKQAPRPVPGKNIPTHISNDASSSRGATIIKPSNTNEQKTAGDSQARPVRVYRSGDDTSSTSKPTPDTRPGRRFFENAMVQDNAETPENTQITPLASPKQPLVSTPKKNSNESAGLSKEDNPFARPLHERLSQFRRSAFDDPSKRVAAGDSVKEDLLPVHGESPQPITSKTEVVDTTGRPTPAKRTTGAASSDQLTVAERSVPTSRMDSIVASNASEEQSAPKTIAVKEAVKFSANLETPATKENNILFARKGPVLSVETHGPRKITVGKESTYEVKIINSGDVAAENMIVFVNLPEWAEVIGSESSIGAAQAGPAGQIPAGFQWNAGHLGAKSQEKLALRIVPRQSRPFDLAVRWEFIPAASQTMIEVQEPKLEMQLEGPREVYYGKKETYRLKLLNSGTGSAEGVVIKFVPIGAGENVPAAYELGVLSAGEDKVIEVDLTARQSGMLEIRVEAQGEAGVHAELAEKVLVRRAGLEIGMEGPKLQFVGTTANYIVRVRNTGNAPAKNINFTVALPAGLKYTGGIEGARADSGDNKLHWTAESINPEVVGTFTIKCVPSAAGISRLEVAVAADDDLTASSAVVTQVESVANLALDVKDPDGPVPVGEEATYEIRVRNRGTKDAESVEVIGYFSRGVEPIAAEGGANRLGSGQVVYSPIPTLAPGGELVFKVRARADAPGNHIFRAEMHCKALGSRLVSEQATLYYQDALAIPQNLQARPPLDRSIR